MAQSLNKVMLIGNLTRDPESRTTPNGQMVATFSVATNRSWNNAAGERQEKSEFHNIVSWGKLAEIVSKYLAKGRRVYVEGRLQTRDWEGQDGVKRYRTEIVADNIIMLDRAPGAGASGPFQPSEPSGPHDASNDQPFPQEPEIQLENIPF
jgi:single-strand DNA-binding protein